MQETYHPWYNLCWGIPLSWLGRGTAILAKGVPYPGLRVPLSWGIPWKVPGTRNWGTPPEGTWDIVSQWTDTCLWKHYLPPILRTRRVNIIDGSKLLSIESVSSHFNVLFSANSYKELAIVVSCIEINRLSNWANLTNFTKET